MGEVIYKEITPYTDNADRWKDITINSGASQRTLDDIKLPETAGCFTYGGNRKHAEGTSNRFIYWRTFNDVMELVEISLDANLRGNCLRLHFERSPILQGVSIHEMSDQVVILVATVSTVHKLHFPHPRKLQGIDHFRKHFDVILPSIFFDASIARIYDHSSFYVLNHTMSAKVPLPHTSCSWLMPSGEAAFVLANRLGSHLLVVMEEQNGAKVTVTELKRTSVMSRLWNGLVRSNQSGDIALSIVCHLGPTDAYIFSLCRDLRIRMWSQNKQECVMIAPLFEHLEENGNLPPCNYNAQQCHLKKSVGTSPSEYFLGVYISQPPQNQFFVFQPLLVADQYKLSLIAMLYHEKHDLVDFCLSSSFVWSLWLNSESEPVVKMTAIERDDNEMHKRVSWLNVELEPAVSRDVFVFFGEIHPKEAYMKEIFRQGRFSPSTVAKALNIYRRVADSSFSSGSTPSLGYLREEAVKVVEHEIYTRIREADITDEEQQQELQIECWDKFFSYCIQYHEVGTKPLGLAFDPSSGYAIVIKKNIYSLLCPCDAIEQLLLSDISCYNPLACVSNEIVREDSALSFSVIAIFKCLDILRQHMSEDMLLLFEQDLQHLQPPDDVVVELIKELEVIPGDSEGCLIAKLMNQLNMATNFLPALKLLLRKIDLTTTEEESEADDVEASFFRDYPHFLSGMVGLSVLCEGVSQFVRQRFAFSRDLLILELIVIKHESLCGISSEVARKMEVDAIPLTKLLVQSYCTLQWCTECEYTPKQTAFLESGLTQLSLLDIHDASSPSKFKSDSNMVRTVVFYFLLERGRSDAYSTFAQNCNGMADCNNWMVVLPQMIMNITRLLWPLGQYFYFPEFLLSQCQYLQLQNYVRLLEGWCEWNSYSRKFLSANCLLIMGEHERALELFIKVSRGVEQEEYVHHKIMQGIESSSSSIAEYYMKVIQMFEHYRLSHCIITLAKTAIVSLSANDPHIPIFYSLAFKHHLELGNSKEAFTALKCNPDPSRQKDCLRQLIVVLCENKQYQTLIEFPYESMQDEVVTILESRARSSDILKQDFYDLLYAFHIHTNNYRKAASITYEHGMRLSQEVNNLEGLRRQANCYLITINCLHLVNEKYAWIVKPVPTINDFCNGTDNSPPNMSPKRNYDGEEVHNTAACKKIEVLEISDIRREYNLIKARLLLVERDQSSTNIAATPLSAMDCVALLINVGLFDTAIELCKSHSLSLIPVFDGLTYRCVNLLQSQSQLLKEKEGELFDWLNQNESVIHPVGGGLSVQEQVWYLLKQYLKQHEKKGQTIFHRCITTKLLSFGMQLPAWLKCSYQKCNAAELLQLYIKHGMLESATELAVDYIDSVLRNEGRDYGVMYPLQAAAPSIWMPHTYFDALLDALEDVHSEVNCRELYKKFTRKLKEYDDKVLSISEEMLLTSNSMTF